LVLAPQRPCTTPGCPNRAAAGRCDTCRGRQRRSSNHRREGWAQLYGTDWPAIRLDYLTRNPYCALCPRAATVADHYPRGIRLLHKQRVLNPNADKYLRPLCKRCHDRETAKHQPGGWNRDRAPR
jgi:5-methylcytosine-specific restriction enzyme A